MPYAEMQNSPCAWPPAARSCARTGDRHAWPCRCRRTRMRARQLALRHLRARRALHRARIHAHRSGQAAGGHARLAHTVGAQRQRVRAVAPRHLAGRQAARGRAIWGARKHAVCSHLMNVTCPPAAGCLLEAGGQSDDRPDPRVAPRDALACSCEERPSTPHLQQASVCQSVHA